MFYWLFGKSAMQIQAEIQADKCKQWYEESKKMKEKIFYFGDDDFEALAVVYSRSYNDVKKLTSFSNEFNGMKVKFIRKDQIKMTRDEAIKNCCHGIAYPEAFVQALEALGLIKFDEPKITPFNEQISLKLNEAVSPKDVKLVLDMIEHLGWTISR